MQLSCSIEFWCTKSYFPVNYSEFPVQDPTYKMNFFVYKIQFHLCKLEIGLVQRSLTPSSHTWMKKTLSELIWNLRQQLRKNDKQFVHHKQCHLNLRYKYKPFHERTLSPLANVPRKVLKSKMDYNKSFCIHNYNIVTVHNITDTH